MTKEEQTRLIRFRLKLLRCAESMPRGVSRACRHFGISVKSFYKWKKRFKEHGEAGLSATMRQAYGCNNVVHARKLLQNLARTLRADHPSAAASVEEGLEETLTVMGMRLPRSLERVLSTTNIIENLIGSTRDLSHRVKRWRDGQMIVRWTATAVHEASKKFRRIAGHKSVPRLVALLRDHVALEQDEKVAQ